MEQRSLTSLVKAGGCGSKIGPGELRDVLKDVPKSISDQILFGLGSGDDAGVFKLRDDLALVQTVDFFTPIVDDPYDFGAIAATNALSDCFALGAKPITGLAIVGFPNELPLEILREILRGGADKVHEAGASIIGGHSIRDSEPKYGVAVTGIVDPRRMVTNAGAKPGNLIVLTKALGTGIVTNERRARATGKSPAELQDLSDTLFNEAVTSMKTLNQKAAELMVEFGATACTDVTGFGLLGHAHNLASASGVALEIDFRTLPLFDGLSQIASNYGKGGCERNRKWVEVNVQFGPDLDETTKIICSDPQTSGPLLVSLPDGAAQTFVQTLQRGGVSAATIIGTVTRGEPGTITVR
jgi:selenide,water dikinase